ncbi:MAG: AraC family transcriptional regulator [Ruminococcaceae bacterium]|nr:AraC family transcriptional regulator [Oscillospiraceae bacterium]
MKEAEKAFSFDFEIENALISIVLQGGFFDFQFDNSFRVHNHSDYEFHFALQNDVAFKTETGTFSLDKSDIFIIAPYTIHSCISGTERTFKMSFCFSFSKTRSKSKKDVYRLLTDSFSEISSAKQIKATAKQTEIMEHILSVFYSEKPFAQARLKAYFSLLFLEIAEKLTPAGSTTAPSDSHTAEPRVARAIIEEYVNRNYNKNISVRELSGILYLCEKQVSRVVKKEFGMTFRQLVAKTRYSVAIYLLANTDVPVTEIAARVGYNSYNGFYNMFLANAKIPPEQYRMAIRKKA